MKLRSLTAQVDAQGLLCIFCECIAASVSPPESLVVKNGCISICDRCKAPSIWLLPLLVAEICCCSFCYRAPSICLLRLSVIERALQRSQTEMQPSLLTNDSGGLNEAAVHSHTDTQQASLTNLRSERSEFHNSMASNPLDCQGVLPLSNN